MESPLEKLNLLEKKITSLVGKLKVERENNDRLLAEKQNLMTQLESLENSLLKGTKSIEELNQERVLTKMVVDDLIRSIDGIVEIEQEK